MGSADRDEHAGFADFEAAEAMNDHHAVDGKRFVNQLADLAHLLQRHRSVGFVFKVVGRPPVGLVADKAVESNDGPVKISSNKFDQRGSVNRLLHQFKFVVFA